jgi:hypothetical protein
MGLLFLFDETMTYCKVRRETLDKLWLSTVIFFQVFDGENQNYDLDSRSYEERFVSLKLYLHNIRRSCKFY